ncbi:hypothetical protein ccbrp13_35620 [Ktedonobacteria bacterium brp13]|nr:hypothetical protein ccbrp13_35620 [Ktedonobacteria bacterium brp13]
MSTKMKVYCPCKKQCSGFSGNPRRCEHVGTSATMPQEFLDQTVNQSEGFFGKLVAGSFGLFGSALVEKGGGKLTYHVYRCPVCKCKVLVQSFKTGNDTKMEEIDVISHCRG